jgi:hypothetical protein
VTETATPPPGSGWTPPSDWRPIPDPTALTTAAVDQATAEYRRALASLRELLETRLSAMDKATELLAATVGRVPSEMDKAISGMKELIDTRLKAMDQANELLATGVTKDLNSLQEILTGEVSKVQAVSIERYENIRQGLVDVQALLDGKIRTVQDVAQEKFTAIEGTFASNALALTAALAAQKEAAAEQNKSNTLAINKSEQATKEASLANQAQTTNSLASQAATIADLRSRLDALASIVVPRNETDAWRTTLTTKVDEGLRNLTERLVALELRLQSRLDLGSGTAAGAAGQRLESRADEGLNQGGINNRLVVLGVAVSVIVIVVNIVIALIIHKP